MGCAAPAIMPLASSLASTQSLQPSPSLVDTSPFPAQALGPPHDLQFPSVSFKGHSDPQDQEKRKLSPHRWLFHTCFVFCRALAPSQLLTSLSPLTNAAPQEQGLWALYAQFKE